MRTVTLDDTGVVGVVGVIVIDVIRCIGGVHLQQQRT